MSATKKRGYLTEQVRRKPYSVILLDEVEKAHPDVFNILLQVLDDGRLTDGQGRTVDFKNTVIVMTSNIGSQHIQQMGIQDYGAVEEVVLEDVKGHFLPETDQPHRRSGRVLRFGSGKYPQHCENPAQRFGKSFGKTKRAPDCSDAALDIIVIADFDPIYGARPLKRAIQSEIENPLAKALLAGNYAPESEIRVEADGDRLKFA